jgi:23S rRNA pseudouridine2605 synthase
MEERLQKILARAGFGSRRTCEVMIADGRVTVNSEVAILGRKANPQKDKIAVNGAPLNPAEPLVYVAMYKPRGVLSAVTSPERRTTVLDLLDIPQRLPVARIYPVGRLDVDSEGLVLLTNDGELTNRLTHPRYGHEKEYRVLVARHPDQGQLEVLRRGIVLEDGYRTASAQVKIESLAGKGTWLQFTLKEGHKRQIREMCKQIGLPVVRLVRVRIGSLYLGNLKPRQWRYLTEKEVAEIRKGVSMGGSVFF